MNKLLSQFSSESALLIIHVSVCVSYLCKAIIKLLCGIAIASPVLVNDGLHGFIDIAEHIVISLVSRIARDGDTSKYPLGKMPLLDIVELAIGFSVVCLGFRCFAESLEITLVGMDSLWGISNIMPQWLWHALAADTSLKQSPVLIALIMLGCWVISILTYNIEMTLAILHDWKEYRADAKELFQDSLVELIISVGMLLVAGLLFFVPPRTSGFNISHLLSIFATPGMLLFLSFHFLYSGWQIVSGSCHELLNPPLDKKHILKLVSAVNKNLPAGCFIIESGEKGIKMWKRSSRVYVIGNIEIDNKCWKMADTIIEDCNALIYTFISGMEENYEPVIYVQPYKLNCENAIEVEWEAWVRKILGANFNNELFQGFVFLRKGEFSSLEYCINKAHLYKYHSIEYGFLLWLKGQAVLDMYGGLSEQTKDVLLKIKKYCEASKSNAVIWLLKAWQIVMYIQLPSDKHKPSIHECLNEVAAAVKDINIPLEIRAECAFALGIYWERDVNYNIPKSNQYYRKALSFYYSSVAPSEADRLLNTWGHQKTLMLELPEAKYLITRSMNIKRKKGDIVGLAYSSGCLADNETRQGQYQEALINYDRDLRYLKTSQVPHRIPSVQIKRAECMLRMGFFSSDFSLIEESQKIALELTCSLPKEQTAKFFATKCLFKCIFAAYLLGFNKAESTTIDAELLASVELDIKNFSSYIDALFKRMKARYYLMSGDIDNAVPVLQKASKLFESMTYGVEEKSASLQSLLSQFEADIAPAVWGNGKRKFIIEKTAFIRKYISSQGGLTGHVGTLAQKYFIELKEKINKENEIIDIRTSCYKPIFLLEN